MAVSELRLIKHSAEFLPQEQWVRMPKRTRGIYILYKYRPKTKKYDVVYVGMAGGEVKAGIGGRLKSHATKKKTLWTHFSVYEVWDNIREDEVRELEGIFRHIYRKDSRAGKLNKQKTFMKLRRVHNRSIEEGWLSKLSEVE